MAVGEARPGYELWRPNRERPEAVTTKYLTAMLLAATAAIAAIIGIAGFSLMSGGAGMAIVCLVYAFLYAFFAFLVARWSRGILPVAAALSMILCIFCFVGANSWFERDKSGLEEGLLPSSLIGVLVLVLAIVQIVVIAAAFYSFSQNWHVEEERPIGGSGEEYGAGAAPSDAPPQPA